MDRITIGLDDFLDKVYELDIFAEDFLLQDSFYFYTDHIRVKEEEIDEVIEHFDLQEETRLHIEDIISTVKSRKYKETYIDDFWENIKKDIEDNIHRSIWKIIEVMKLGNAEHEEDFKDPELSIYMDFKEKELTFSGDINLLEDIIVSCINGYGMFYYENIEEFRRVCEGYSLKERIESHIHWLKHFPKVWGVSAFNVDLNSVSRHSHGDPDDYTMEDIKEELMMFNSDLLEE